MIRPASSHAGARPPSYVVGARCAPQPLVSPEHVRGHIRLLRAFHDFKTTVDDGKDHRIPAYATRMDKAARWRWFMHLAVERFEHWVGSLQFVTPEKFAAEHVPPLDVWMIWHAYFLSPCWYAEDCERLTVLQPLRSLDLFAVASIDLGQVVQRRQSTARMKAWRAATGTPFDPFEAMTAAEGKFKRIACPRCRTEVFAPFTNDDCTGYAEGRFSVKCPLPGCRLRVTHDNLAVAKFVRDLSEGDEARERFIAGSLFSPSGRRDASHAKAILEQLWQSDYFAELRPLVLDERFARLDRIKETKENIGYSLAYLKEAIMASLMDCPAASVTRILSAYTSGSPFSIDLVDAVHRQCQFTEQIYELGWLEPATFHGADKNEILMHSVMRYHAFLDLMTVHPGAILVPTLDIDLVWHTHQLMASKYNSDCEMYVGRIVDHGLDVAESRLSSAFNDTCRAWLARFEVSYVRCGCPVPDETETSMHKFVRLFRHRLRGRSQLPVDLHPEHLPATHPSSHNALLTFQTVCTGTFGKMHHHHHHHHHQDDDVRGEKRKAERSRSPRPGTPHDQWTYEMSERRTSHTHIDWTPPERSQTISSRTSTGNCSARPLPAVPKLHPPYTANVDQIGGAKHLRDAY